MKKRILFVDDEPRVLEGLEDLLARHRRKWEMGFASGRRGGPGAGCGKRHTTSS